MIGYKSIAFIGLAAVLSACGDEEYDPDGIQKQITENANAIKKLEQNVNSLNDEISALRTMVNAIKSNVYVSSATETADGWLMVFTDGNTVLLRHGRDGSGGNESLNNPNATVSIAEYFGVYYWTITVNGSTDWLLDKAGNKIPVTGTNGLLGINGVNGTNGVDGINGTDGKDGADGVTPQLRVDEYGFWQVSYDGGSTYTNLKDANGGDIIAVGQGDSGDSLIQSMEVTDTHVYIVLHNGTSLKIPRISDFYMTIEGLGQTDFIPGIPVTMSFTIVGADPSTFVEFYAQGNVEASLEYKKGASAGKITVMTTDAIDRFTKVLIFLCNDKETITTVIR